MHVIKARNVNDAYHQGLTYLISHSQVESSRAGKVLVAPTPVTICYQWPAQRVLFDLQRDANPFFHLFEALWMLAGRNDATWLDRFVSDFSARFAEPDGHQHGAYGYRWRHHFDAEGAGRPGLPDQLETCIQLLKVNPSDRQVVLQMWDPVADLAVPDYKDRPCNISVMPRINAGLLDIMVTCRSNDAVWGAFGANAVHFSVLLEYMAGRLGIPMGRYYQVANNFHVYTDVLAKLGTPSQRDPYTVGDVPAALLVRSEPMGQDWDAFDRDLARFMAWTDSEEPDMDPQQYPRNPWFHETAEPLFVAHYAWKRGDKARAVEIVFDDAWNIAPDWRVAAQRWFARRMSKAKQKAAAGGDL